ncbi:MAG TPA: hypothetical protein VGM89_20025 [Puia sp.]
MLYLLTALAVLFFILHVGYLLASFPGGGFNKKRYFISHLTLWLTGLLVFLLATLFAGKGVSAFLDYFDTTTKRLMILAAAAALSLIAHIIVRWLVLPTRRSA